MPEMKTSFFSRCKLFSSIRIEPKGLASQTANWMELLQLSNRYGRRYVAKRQYTHYDIFRTEVVLQPTVVGDVFSWKGWYSLL